MAFISYTYNGCDPATNQYFYTLTDSEFGAVEFSVGIAGWVAVAVVREYGKRGLDVGRNLALLALYQSKQLRTGVADITRRHDRHCGEHIENWFMYAEERDEHLKKLLALL